MVFTMEVWCVVKHDLNEEAQSPYYNKTLFVIRTGQFLSSSEIGRSAKAVIF